MLIVPDKNTAASETTEQTKGSEAGSTSHIPNADTYSKAHEDQLIMGSTFENYKQLEKGIQS